MNERLMLRLFGLLLAVSAAPAIAQQQLSDSERAKRDAAKVFNFIKFHAVRAKSAPVSAPVAATAAAAVVAANPPAAVPDRNRVSDAAPSPKIAIRETVAPVEAPPSAATVVVEAQPGTSLPPQSEPPAAAAPAPTVAAPVVAEPEPEPELVELKLVHHVLPELPRGNNLRDGTVRVRFTVEVDGRVSKATAAEGVARRLAMAAVRAIEQWRFEPVSQSQEVEVDIDFRFDGA